MKTFIDGVMDTLTKSITKFRKKNSPKYAKGSKKWLRTYDLYCHTPNFKIDCRHCNAKMFLRFSQILSEKYMTLAIRDAVNVVEYKCPRCSWVKRFYVDDEPQYLFDMLDVRDGITQFTPPIDVWKSESAEIKQRLEILGYL